MRVEGTVGGESVLGRLGEIIRWSSAFRRSDQITMISLKDSIAAAFENVPYPGDDHLTIYPPEHRKFDETFNLLRGRHWRDMPVDQFISGDTPFPDLTPEAFHFYMPALLIASIDPDFQFCSDVAFSVTYNLSPASAKNTDGPFPFDNTLQWNARMQLFDRTQSAVIVCVLEEYVKLGWETSDTIADTVNFLQSDD